MMIFIPSCLRLRLLFHLRSSVYAALTDNLSRSMYVYIFRSALWNIGTILPRRWYVPSHRLQWLTDFSVKACYRNPREDATTRPCIAASIALPKFAYSIS